MVVKAERFTASPDQYREYATQVRALFEFMKQGAQWDNLHEDTKQQYRRTLKSLEQAAQQTEFVGMSLAQVAEALIERFESKAERVPQPLQEFPTARVPDMTQPVQEPRQLFDRVYLPQLEDKQWDVVFVDTKKRTYVLADPYDRRSPDDIVSDARAGRSGRYQTHEVSWEQLEELAKKAA